MEFNRCFSLELPSAWELQSRRSQNWLQSRWTPASHLPCPLESKQTNTPLINCRLPICNEQHGETSPRRDKSGKGGWKSQSSRIINSSWVGGCKMSLGCKFLILHNTPSAGEKGKPAGRTPALITHMRAFLHFSLALPTSELLSCNVKEQSWA